VCTSTTETLCEAVAGGFAQELLGYMYSVLASSNDTFVSQVAPKLKKSVETVLNITEKLSSAAEPGERLLDSKLRDLTSQFNQTLQSLMRRTADFHAAHTSILKAARRSYLPGIDQHLERCILWQSCSLLLFPSRNRDAIARSFEVASTFQLFI